jgi:hypothetical protein
MNLKIAKEAKYKKNTYEAKYKRTHMKLNTKEHIKYDSIHLIFKPRLNYSIAIKVRICVTFLGY